MKTTQAIVRGLISILGASQLCTLAMAGAETLPTSTGPEEMALVEIVVTAQKRSENMQDVPIAITSITADRLESAGIGDARDLTVLVPALDVTASGGHALPSLRGVGTSLVGPGFESPVAFYVDGIYIADAASTFLSFNNIAQIDVLKGPQGTLFGRNATGGVIQLTTLNPSEQFDGKASASYGNYQTVGAKAYVTTGIAPNLAADLAVQYSTQGQGYGTNLATGRDTNRTAHEWAARTKLRYAPEVGPEIVLSADYADLLTSQGVAIREVNGQIPATHDPLTGAAFPFTGKPWDINSDGEPRMVTKGGGLSLRVEQNVGAARIVGITAARRTRHDVDFDIDLTPVPFFYVPLIEREDEFTQEIRLQSSNDGRFRWMTGAYYFGSTGKFDPSELQLLPGLPFQSNLTTYSNTTAHSIAAFGEVNVDLARATRLTIGLRGTHEKREAHAEQLANGGFLFVFPPTTIFPSRTITETRPTWRLGLDHKFDDNLVYASYNRGFKSGGFNAGTPSQDPYNPEILDAYELGIKSVIAQRFRLNDAIYYYKYSNYQAAFFNQSNIEVANAAARIYGGDADLEALVTQSLRLNVGAAYSHARFTSFPLATLNTPLPIGGNSEKLGSADGNHLPYAPDVTANFGFDYSWNVSGGKLDLDANYYHNGGWYSEADNVQRQKKYELVNSSLTWSAAKDAYWVRLWGKNLTDRAVATQISSSAFGTAVAYQAPRTFGLEFGAKFPTVQ